MSANMNWTYSTCSLSSFVLTLEFKVSILSLRYPYDEAASVAISTVKEYANDFKEVRTTIIQLPALKFCRIVFTYHLQ